MVLRNARRSFLLIALSAAGVPVGLAPCSAQADSVSGMPVIAGYQAFERPDPVADLAGNGNAISAVTRFVRRSGSGSNGQSGNRAGINAGAWRVPDAPKLPGSIGATRQRSEETPAGTAAISAAANSADPAPVAIAKNVARRLRVPVDLVAGVALPGAIRFLIGVEADLGVMLVPGQARPASYSDPAGRIASPIGQFVLFNPFANLTGPFANLNRPFAYLAGPASGQTADLLPDTKTPAPSKPLDLLSGLGGSNGDRVDRALPVAWSRIGDADFAVTGDIGGRVNHWRLALGGFGGLNAALLRR
ncbi:MAG: hypothetical protein ACTSSQ_07815 [Alphaproteobacteria bacterium]